MFCACALNSNREDYFHTSYERDKKRQLTPLCFAETETNYAQVPKPPQKVSFGKSKKLWEVFCPPRESLSPSRCPGMRFCIEAVNVVNMVGEESGGGGGGDRTVQSACCFSGCLVSGAQSLAGGSHSFTGTWIGPSPAGHLVGCSWHVAAAPSHWTPHAVVT